MGGFARYPWPQYINNAPFLYNKYYKRCVVLCLVSGVFNYMWAHRYLTSHQLTDPGYGSYIDPEHQHAPTTIRLN